MTKGIDCATPITASAAKALAASGYRFAARYLVPANYAWKRLTRSKAAAIAGAGLMVVSVYETTANRPAGGAANGRADGASARAEAELIGQPAGSAIYFAVDYDAQPGDYDAIEAYLKAAAAQLPNYTVGVYGSYAVIEEMARRGACRHFWQTYAWSRGNKSARANIYQYSNEVRLAGMSVDLNESYGGEGWWNANGETQNDNEEGEIAMSKEDAEKIIRFLSAAWFAAPSAASKAEFNRLANEVRKAAGLPVES